MHTTNLTSADAAEQERQCGVAGGFPKAGAWAVCVSVTCAMMCVSVRRECQVNDV
jgi:hypothetical protein